MLRPAVVAPWRRHGTRPRSATLPDDHKIIGIRIQNLVDEFFADMRAVRVGGVDEVHAQLDGAAKHRLGLIRIGWRPPDTGPGDAHGPESEPVDGEVAAEVHSA